LYILEIFSQNNFLIKKATPLTFFFSFHTSIFTSIPKSYNNLTQNISHHFIFDKKKNPTEINPNKLNHYIIWCIKIRIYYYSKGFLHLNNFKNIIIN